MKPDMLFGKRGKSGLVALNLDLAQVAQFVKSRLCVEVIMNYRDCNAMHPFNLHCSSIV